MSCIAFFPTKVSLIPRLLPAQPGYKVTTSEEKVFKIHLCANCVTDAVLPSFMLQFSCNQNWYVVHVVIGNVYYSSANLKTAVILKLIA